MESDKNVGRIVGVLLLLQVVGGVLVNFVLLKPALAAPGFLANAAPNSQLVSLAVVLSLVAGAVLTYTAASMSFRSQELLGRTSACSAGDRSSSARK